MRKHIERLKNVLKLSDRTWHFDIHPDQVLSFFLRQKYVFGWGIFILIIILIFTNTLSTRASVARFYSESCLGGWGNPQEAQGRPEVTTTSPWEEAVSAALGVLTYDREEYERELKEKELAHRQLREFNHQNSAVLDNQSAEIFCGDFRGEIPTDTFPQKFILKFSWEMKDLLDDKVESLQTIDTILKEGINPEVIEPIPETELPTSEDVGTPT